MVLQYLELTGKLVREPVKEIRLKQIAVVVIPATFLAAISSAALALSPTTIPAGIAVALWLQGVFPLRMLSGGW